MENRKLKISIKTLLLKYNYNSQNVYDSVEIINENSKYEVIEVYKI